MDSLKTAKVNAVPSASDFSRMYLADAFAKNVYFPGLPKDSVVTRIAFFRRKPKGFSNGHYLMTNPLSAPRMGRRLVGAYFGVYCFFWGVICHHQHKVGKWF
eukprot:TRINITY_DN56352_c0_g1_i1.p2 TRINITY_DN56352_c0_g1~~TRINITY_DN56352_c0_g1_i1.p2  ORF type:complete len:102 (+),score=4.46 TRINITY_DN56352_c0_g1_i1:22-327(+)